MPPPIAQWTQSDLDYLPKALEECKRVAKARGTMIAPEMGLKEIATTVVAASEESARRVDEKAARERYDRDRARLAAEQVARDREQAEEGRRVAEAERAEVVQQATQEAARAEAEIAAANARRDTQLARQRMAEAQARARAAAADADRAKAAADRSEAAAARSDGDPRLALVEPVPAPARPAGTSVGPVFGFTLAALRDRYDGQLKKDGDSGIASCTATGSSQRCRFDEASFWRSVDAMKRLDLANGRFELKLALSIAQAGDQVAHVTLQGDRADPMNLFAFIGKVGSLIQVLEPAIGEHDRTMLIASLGISRGDDDPGIGREKNESRPTFAVSCRGQLARISTGLVCDFTPRS